jgi:MFS family permease
MLGAVLGFMAIILEDPNYYNIDKTLLGKELGNISMICEAVVIAEELVMGVIVDTFGRKIPLLTGWLVAGLAFATVPLFTSLYPAFLIVRMLIYCGLIVGANIPLLPDYV